jgi:tetratricopeptide (TPR) repeat protein
MCSEKSRRTKQALLDVLAKANIAVRPPRRTRKWHDDLRHTKKLLGDDEPELALSLLIEVESDFRNSGIQDGQVIYRISQHKATAFLLLGRYQDALHSAQRALDHDPEGINALVNLAQAQTLCGDTDSAIATAARATTKTPQSPHAWGIRFQLSLMPGQPPIDIPPDIASSSEFRLGLAEIHLSSGEVAQARDVIASLIKEGDRSAHALLLRADTLIADIESAGDGERLPRAQEAERLCSEVLDGEASLSTARTQRALVNRSLARRILGNLTDAQEDSERAHSLRPDNTRALETAAATRVQVGDEAGALEILVGPVVENSPWLLAMRACLLARIGQAEKARRDLDAVLQAIAAAPEPDVLRAAAAEAALFLSDVALAKKLVSEMSSGERAPSVPHIITLARIAVLENDLSEAESQYRKAIELDPALRAEHLIELGSRLLQAKRENAAAEVFREAGPLTETAERMFVQALVLSDRLFEAHEVLEHRAEKGPMPNWALGFAAQIALRRNDPKSGAAHLEDLFSRGVTTFSGRLMLAQTLVELNEHDRARFHSRALVSNPELTPRERMWLAQLLSKLGDSATAIQEGMRAFRDLPHDADLNRAFASMVLQTKSAPVEVDCVGPDTHVLLREGDNKTSEYVIFAAPAASRLPNEITVQDAQTAGVLGLRIGEVITRDKGTFFESQWQVEQVQSVVRYLVNDIIGNYGRRFLGAAFFVTSFSFNMENPGVNEFQPLIGSAHERERHQKELLTLYYEKCLPLGLFAKFAGVTVPDLIAKLSRLGGEGPFYVEFHDEGRLASRDAARSQLPTILSRSALHTAQAFGNLHLLTHKRTLLAPRSLWVEIDEELAEAEDRIKNGWTVLSPSERGFAIHHLEPGDPALVSERESILALRDWVETNVTVASRPLEVFSDQRMKDHSETRAGLGESSSHALELAMFVPGVLFADDLGLRKVCNGLGLSSFSTISLIQVLAEEGVLAARERDKMLVNMAERHYYRIELSPEVLVEALAPGRPLQTTREVFSLLAGPPMDAHSSARMLVRAVKAVALQDVKTTTAERVVREGLEAMVKGFQPMAFGQAVWQAAGADLILLPRERHVVLRAIQDLLKP